MKGYPLAALALAILTVACGDNSRNGATDVAGADDGVQLVPDTAVGAEYGATGPRKCSTKKVPASGPPSNETIAKYVICDGEHVMGDNVYLYDNVQVTAVASGRPYNPNEDVNMSNIDINKPVYAIKGSLRGYQCGRIMKPGGYDGGPSDHKGTNCNRTPQPNASGLCYQDTFADWYCSLLDVNAPVNAEREIAAP